MAIIYQSLCLGFPVFPLDALNRQRRDDDERKSAKEGADAARAGQVRHAQTGRWQSLGRESWVPRRRNSWSNPKEENGRPAFSPAPSNGQKVHDFDQTPHRAAAAAAATLLSTSQGDIICCRQHDLCSVDARRRSPGGAACGGCRARGRGRGSQAGRPRGFMSPLSIF